MGVRVLLHKHFRPKPILQREQGRRTVCRFARGNSHVNVSDLGWAPNWAVVGSWPQRLRAVKFEGCAYHSMRGHWQQYGPLAQAGNYDFIRAHRPAIVINENVKALEFGQSGEQSLVAQIQAQYKELGYSSIFWLLTPTQFGIPQSRPRVYLLALDRPLQLRAPAE